MTKITGAQVREARIASGYTQQAMADLLGHTMRNYQRKEEGRLSPSGEMLSSIMPGEFYFMKLLALGSPDAVAKTIKATRLLTRKASKQGPLSSAGDFIEALEKMSEAIAELDQSKPKLLQRK